ncbi:hypothetical protein AURDEDRAFT_122784 [Auricularia subglabra TFB-10046 SS5]|nr:hypothetical protein AURDEDRAFT_122784 [Auricularia subglabra TFB-10046 SS5]
MDTRDITGIDRALPSFAEFASLEYFASGRVRVSPEALSAMTSAPPRTLHTLSLRSAETGVYTLPSLPQLTSLCWETDASVIDLAVDRDGPTPSFPLLAELDLSGYSSGTFLRSMPALQSIEFDGCGEPDVRLFLKAHGAKLRTVKNDGELDMLRTILGECPNATCVDVSWGSMPPSCMGPATLSAPQTALEELVIPPLDRLGGGTADAADPEIALSRSCSRAPPPAAHRPHPPAQPLADNAEPETNGPGRRKMAKHPMSAIAEKLPARGIRIVDENGEGWKPRMTTAGKRKKQAA